MNLVLNKRRVGVQFDRVLGISFRHSLSSRFLLAWFIAMISSGGGVALGATVTNLSLLAARAMAVASHPRLSVAQLRAVAIKQSVTIARAPLFPMVSLNGTAVGNGGDNTRIAAGGLNNPVIYERAAVGLSFTQLLTDFGRTSQLLDAAKLEARASDTNVVATRAQLLMEVDSAFFNTLRGLGLQRVAEERLTQRQLVLENVSTLASNQLKSQLDVGFARVGVEEARLLVDQAKTEWQAAQIALASLVGIREYQSLQPADDTEFPAVPPDSTHLVLVALNQRPELIQARLERDAARHRARAEIALDYPTISAFGSGGLTPIHDEHLDQQFAAAGVNINVPVFNGGIYRARQRQTDALASAADAHVRDQEDAVIREVRVAWLEAHHAGEEVVLAQQLVQSADEARDLAKARYDQGLSSFIELSQAEFNDTTAHFTQINSRYEFLLRRDRMNYAAGMLQ